MEPEQIAAALVSVTRRGQANVWVVEFGAGRDRYQMMYDTEAVAGHFAGAIRAAIVEGIHRAVGADTPHVVEPSTGR